MNAFYSGKNHHTLIPSNLSPKTLVQLSAKGANLRQGVDPTTPSVAVRQPRLVAGEVSIIPVRRPPGVREGESVGGIV